MLTSRQLARELINRKRSTQGLDTSITTSSYEMINPDQETDVDTSDDSPRRHFWGLPLRRKPQNRPQDEYQQEQGVVDGRRVVSEPVMSGRRGMSVLRRFRFGRQDVEEDEHEGDLTISTETDVSIERNEEEEISPIPPKHRPTRSVDSGPSFISFAPTTPSSTTSSQRRSRQRPRNPTPQSAISRQSSFGQLAPILDPASDTPTRGAAIRAVTTEARLADVDTSFSTEESGSVEYPNYVDTSSSMGGILRARHSRVPNNTPVQNVRFLDSPRTEYLRRKAREGLEQDRHLAMMADTPEPLPPPQITQSSRWVGLGNILNIMENENRDQIAESEAGSMISTPPQTPVDPTTPVHPRVRHKSTNYSASNSPISFARFDPPEPICSTPLRRYRFPAATSSPEPTFERSLSDPLNSPLSASDLSVVSSPAWSRRFADEDEVVEVCTALEALWEYGSSSEEEAGMATEAEVVETKQVTHPDPGAGVETGQKKIEFPGDRRGSADLLPLKFKGYPKEIVEEPFPFASSLRF